LGDIKQKDMKKYNFELQSLLNVKEQKEDLLMNQLSTQRKHIQKLEDEISNLKNKRDNNIKEFENNIKKSSKIYEITSFYSYLEKLDANIKDLNKVLIKETKKLKEIINELKTASKEKKVLDKLKEKDFSSYKRELTIEENKLNDERNSYVHYSNNIN
jgi:flagellar FliJ protein